MRLDIKPLSSNDTWKGRRFKTKEYKAYERHICLLLKPMEIPEGQIILFLEFGFSSSGSDWDNPIKPFQDCLQKKYDFNDNRVYAAVVTKEKVKKGEEYIDFKIESLEKYKQKLKELLK